MLLRAKNYDLGLFTFAVRFLNKFFTYEIGGVFGTYRKLSYFCIVIQKGYPRVN